MSVSCMNWAWKVQGLSAPEKLVLVAISDRADDDGFCYPGQQSLAAKCSITDRGLRGILDRLVEKGLLEIENRPGRGDGRQTNTYQLVMGNRNAVPIASRQPEAGAGQPERHAWQPEPGSSNTSVDTSVKQTQGLINGQRKNFDVFWSAFPRKVGKAVAEKIWMKLKPSDELLGRMVAALEAQKMQPGWLKDGGQYIPHPATWLRQERWNDVLRVERGSYGGGVTQRNID